MLKILDLVVSVVGEKRIKQGSISRIAQHHIPTTHRPPHRLRLHHVRNETPDTRHMGGARHHVPFGHHIHLSINPRLLANMCSQTPLVRETVPSCHASDQLNLVLRLKHVGATWKRMASHTSKHTIPHPSNAPTHDYDDKRRWGESQHYGSSEEYSWEHSSVPYRCLLHHIKSPVLLLTRRSMSRIRKWVVRIFWIARFRKMLIGNVV